MKDNTYMNVSKGVTSDKYHAEDNLIKEIITVGGAMYVYSRKKKDGNLSALTRVTESGLKKMRDTELLQKAKEIQARLTSLQEELADYGIGLDAVTDYTSRVSTYESALSALNSRGATSKAAREELKEAFAEADEVLNEDLDTMMELVKSSNGEFFNQYHAARVIKDL